MTVRLISVFFVCVLFLISFTTSSFFCNLAYPENEKVYESFKAFWRLKDIIYELTWSFGFSAIVICVSIIQRLTKDYDLRIRALCYIIIRISVFILAIILSSVYDKMVVGVFTFRLSDFMLIFVPIGIAIYDIYKWSR